MAYVSVAPFTSVPDKVIAVAVLYATVTDCAVATGAVYTARVIVPAVLTVGDAASSVMELAPLS